MEIKKPEGEWSMSAQIEAAQKRISEWPEWMREAAYFSAALVEQKDKQTLTTRVSNVPAEE